MDTSPNDTPSRSSHHSFSSTINRLFYSGTGSMPSEFAKQTSKSINKLATYSCHISFLKACRDHDIIPRGLRLKNPLKDAKSQATIHSASLKLVKNRLQNFRKSFHQQKVMLDTTLLELKQMLNDEYYDKLLELNKTKTSAIHNKLLTKQAKKFSSLISEFNLPYLSPYQQLQSFNITVSEQDSTSQPRVEELPVLHLRGLWPKHTSCHKWIFNRVGSKTIFFKTC